MNVTVNNYGFSTPRNIAKAVMREIEKSLKDWGCPPYHGPECNTSPPSGVFRRVAKWLIGVEPQPSFCVAGQNAKTGAACEGAWSVWINEDEIGQCAQRIKESEG